VGQSKEGQTMSEENIKKTKEVPCPDCYGGHFRPCNICGDSGVALLVIEEKPKSKEAKP
jgi:hypothetical protein